MRKSMIAALVLTATMVWAEGPWKVKLTNKELEANLKIDLYEESIDVPEMEMFGPMNGYLNGKGIYGTWMVTSCEVKSDKVAVMNLSNDLGSETQTVRLTLQNDTTYLFEQIDGNVIKKAVNRKLVKIPSKFTLTIKK